MTTLAQWLLRAFADHWPTGSLPGDGDPGGPVYLANRDDSVIVDPDTSTDPTTLTPRVPSQEFDLSTGNVIGVATTDYAQTPAGLGGQEYSVEPVLSVRIEGAHERQAGYIADSQEFTDLVLDAVEVVQNIDNGTLQAAPVANFHVAEPGAQNPQMADYKDAYTWQFDVEPEGYRTV